MSKLTSLIRRAPKRFSAVVAMVAAAVIAPAIVFAWGPDRPLYTVANPADHITFNSIKDNPVVGDETNFVVVKDAANTSDGGWQDNITVQPGKEYIVRMYVHNNAATSLNLTAVNTRVMASVPTTTGKNVSVSGFVSADNAQPKQVWDDIHFNGSENFNLAYVAGSAKIYNNGYAKSGQGLPDSIVTNSGALVGYNGPDGKVPGCFEYANYVYFKVKPQFATPSTDFTVKKEVRKSGESTFVESVNAKPGDTLNYRITYTNTGNAESKDVILKDKLPAGISHVPGSVKIMNANNPGGAFVADGDKLFSSGINIGAYTAGSNALVIFNATVANNDQLPVCGTNTLRNVASAQPHGQNPKEDDANAVVPKECKPEDKKITVCELATKKIVTIKESEFNPSKYSKNLKDCETPSKKITVCELATKKIVTIDEKDFNPEKYSKDLKDCEEKKIVVCELATKKIVTIKESDFNPEKYSKNIKDCETPEKIVVCDLTTKKIVTINKADFDDKKYSKNLDDCKAPEKITVCELATKKIVTINKADYDETKYSTDLSKCETPVTPPVTPPELPQTGAGENIVAVIGLGAIIASVSYYVASRRAANL